MEHHWICLDKKSYIICLASPNFQYGMHQVKMSSKESYFECLWLLDENAYHNEKKNTHQWNLQGASCSGNTNENCNVIIRFLCQFIAYTYGGDIFSYHFMYHPHENCWHAVLHLEWCYVLKFHFPYIGFQYVPEI